MIDAAAPPDLELAIPSQLGFEKIAREAIAAFARRHGLGAPEIEDLKTAVCEACINAIEHGNGGDASRLVRVGCCADEQRVLVTICDSGIVEPHAHSAASIEDKVAGRAPARGMGLQIIAELAEETGFDRCPDGGTRFWFTLRRYGPVRSMPA
jgi:serine/threonine-protein kinase RsbW